jgi:hypothetical protein
VTCENMIESMIQRPRRGFEENRNETDGVDDTANGLVTGANHNSDGADQNADGGGKVEPLEEFAHDI